MKDRTKILFPTFRIILGLAVILFAVLVVDIRDWDSMMWILGLLMTAIVIWSVRDWAIIAGRIKKEKAAHRRTGGGKQV